MTDLSNFALRSGSDSLSVPVRTWLDLLQEASVTKHRDTLPHWLRFFDSKVAETNPLLGPNLSDDRAC